MQPLQECMIVLLCLQNQPVGTNTELPRYLIDEVFAVFSAGDSSTDHNNLFSFKPSERYKSSWEVVAKMRSEVFHREKLGTSEVIEPFLDNDEDSQSTIAFVAMKPGLAILIPECPTLSTQSLTEPESPLVVTPMPSTASSQHNNLNNMLACDSQMLPDPAFLDIFGEDFAFEHVGSRGHYFGDMQTSTTF